MDVYPILHREKVYNIITAIDMSFGEVRRMLDWLDMHGAFTVTSEDESLGLGRLFTCELDDVILEVDVHGHEVVIYRRSV
jgi:hypothetical protein